MDDPQLENVTEDAITTTAGPSTSTALEPVEKEGLDPLLANQKPSFARYGTVGVHDFDVRIFCSNTRKAILSLKKLLQLDDSRFWSQMVYCPKRPMQILDTFLVNSPRLYEKNRWNELYDAKKKTLKKIQEEMYRVTFRFMSRLCPHDSKVENPWIRNAMLKMNFSESTMPLFSPARVLDICAIFGKLDLQNVAFRYLKELFASSLADTVDFVVNKVKLMQDENPGAFDGYKSRLETEDKVLMVADLAFATRCLVRVFPEATELLCQQNFVVELATLYDKQVMRYFFHLNLVKHMGFLAEAKRQLHLASTSILKLMKVIILARYSCNDHLASLAAHQNSTEFERVLSELAERPRCYLAYLANFDLQKDIQSVLSRHQYMSQEAIAELAEELKKKAEGLVASVPEDEDDLLPEENRQPLGALAFAIDKVRELVPSLQSASDLLLEEALRLYKFQDSELVRDIQNGNMNPSLTILLETNGIDLVVDVPQAEAVVENSGVAPNEDVDELPLSRSKLNFDALKHVRLIAELVALTDGDEDDAPHSMFAHQPSTFEEYREKKREHFQRKDRERRDANRWGPPPDTNSRFAKACVPLPVNFVPISVPATSTARPENPRPLTNHVLSPSAPPFVPGHAQIGRYTGAPGRGTRLPTVGRAVAPPSSPGSKPVPTTTIPHVPSSSVPRPRLLPTASVEPSGVAKAKQYPVASLSTAPNVDAASIRHESPVGLCSFVEADTVAISPQSENVKLPAETDGTVNPVVDHATIEAIATVVIESHGVAGMSGNGIAPVCRSVPKSNRARGDDLSTLLQTELPPIVPALEAHNKPADLTPNESVHCVTPLQEIELPPEAVDLTVSVVTSNLPQQANPIGLNTWAKGWTGDDKKLSAGPVVISAPADEGGPCPHPVPSIVPPVRVTTGTSRPARPAPPPITVNPEAEGWSDAEEPTGTTVTVAKPAPVEDGGDVVPPAENVDEARAIGGSKFERALNAPMVPLRPYVTSKERDANEGGTSQSQAAQQSQSGTSTSENRRPWWKKATPSAPAALPQPLPPTVAAGGLSKPNEKRDDVKPQEQNWNKTSQSDVFATTTAQDENKPKASLAEGAGERAPLDRHGRHAGGKESLNHGRNDVDPFWARAAASGSATPFINYRKNEPQFARNFDNRVTENNNMEFRGGSPQNRQGSYYASEIQNKGGFQNPKLCLDPRSHIGRPPPRFSNARHSRPYDDRSFGGPRPSFGAPVKTRFAGCLNTRNYRPTSPAQQRGAFTNTSVSNSSNNVRGAFLPAPGNLSNRASAQSPLTSQAANQNQFPARNANTKPEPVSGFSRPKHIQNGKPTVIENGFLNPIVFKNAWSDDTDSRRVMEESPTTDIFYVASWVLRDDNDWSNYDSVHYDADANVPPNGNRRIGMTDPDAPGQSANLGVGLSYSQTGLDLSPSVDALSGSTPRFAAAAPAVLNFNPVEGRPVDGSDDDDGGPRRRHRRHRRPRTDAPKQHTFTEPFSGFVLADAQGGPSRPFGAAPPGNSRGPPPSRPFGIRAFGAPPYERAGFQQHASGGPDWSRNERPVDGPRPGTEPSVAQRCGFEGSLRTLQPGPAGSKLGGAGRGRGRPQV